MSSRVSCQQAWVELTSGNTSYAALLAVLSANIVLFGYVYVAFSEEKAAALEEKKQKSQ